jgi:4a-hydroxytetrahydrobiopterin dehydratase
VIKVRELAQMRCVPCHGGVPSLSEIEIRELQTLVPEWDVIEQGGVQRLVRVYSFNNFSEALNFTNKVGEIAEKEDHHPRIFTEWGKVTISWWTHSIKGLHRNDFIMAARTDVLYE